MASQVHQTMNTPSQGQASSTSSNPWGVTISGWSVTYDAGAGGLTGKCTITPDAGVTLGSIGLAVYPPSLADNSAYAAAIAAPPGSGTSSSAWQMQVSTVLFNPQTEGNTVVSAVLGQSSNGFFFFKQQFTV